MKEVKWERGDASKLHEHKELLSQAAAVISCVGAFGSNECVLATLRSLVTPYRQVYGAHLRRS